MPYSKIWPQMFYGSVESLVHTGTEASLINGPWPFVQSFNPPQTEGSTWNLKKICWGVSEESFKGENGQTQVITTASRAFGSGELKKQKNICTQLFLFYPACRWFLYLWRCQSGFFYEETFDTLCVIPKVKMCSLLFLVTCNEKHNFAFKSI